MASVSHFSSLPLALNTVSFSSNNDDKTKDLINKLNAIELNPNQLKKLEGLANAAPGQSVKYWYSQLFLKKRIRFSL